MTAQSTPPPLRKGGQGGWNESVWRQLVEAASCRFRAMVTQRWHSVLMPRERAPRARTRGWSEPTDSLAMRQGPHLLCGHYRPGLLGFRRRDQAVAIGVELPEGRRRA